MPVTASPLRGVIPWYEAGFAYVCAQPEYSCSPTKNVRGGIPVLFPIAGKPDPGSPYKQHGFARNLPWEAVRTSECSLECRLCEGGWDVLLTFTLSESALRLEAQVHGETPFQLGFHPYFAVSDKRSASVETAATRVFDNRTGETRAFVKPDFTDGEQDLYLLDHPESGTILRRPPQKPIELSWSPEFGRLVLWTLPERPFICVEPWTDRNALTPPQRLSFEIRPA